MVQIYTNFTYIAQHEGYLVQRDKVVGIDLTNISCPSRDLAHPASRQFLTWLSVENETRKRGFFGVETQEKLRTWSRALLGLKDNKFFHLLVRIHQICMF